MFSIPTLLPPGFGVSPTLLPPICGVSPQFWGSCSPPLVSHTQDTRGDPEPLPESGGVPEKLKTPLKGSKGEVASPR